MSDAVLTPRQKTRIWIEHHLLGRLSPAVTLLAYLFLFINIIFPSFPNFNSLNFNKFPYFFLFCSPTTQKHNGLSSQT